MKEISLELLSMLLPVIAAVLTAMSSWAIGLLVKRYKLKLSLDQDEVVRLAIRRAIWAAEEWAARELKLGNKDITGVEKAQWVKSLLIQLYPDLIPNDLDRMLDEELAQIGGLGATK